MKKYIAIFAIFLSFLMIAPQPAVAAKKKTKKKPPTSFLVDAVDVYTISVKLKSGKKTKGYSVQCLDKTPGQTKQSAGSLMFTPLKNSVAKLKKRGGPKYSLYTRLLKASSSQCKKPAFLSLDRYKGPFGEREARILFNRFAFGASPERIKQAVAEGLDRTALQLITFSPEPGLDAIERDIWCDGNMPDSPDNKACQPGINRQYEDGSYLTEGVLYRFLNSQNPFIEKLFFFLHDERAAVSEGGADSSDRFTVINHIDMLRRAARSGDYPQFIRDYTNDQLGHLRWLSGADNLKERPNENFAREFWELLTIGASDLNGVRRYGDLDVAQGALAFTGWGFLGEKEVVSGDWVSYSAYSLGRHASGPKTVFIGQPYQATVDNADDMVNAVLKHPGLSEHLAQDIWHEFIGPNPSDSALRELAALIRTNNYHLLPVFQRVMTSRALFEDRNRNALIKHPVELLIGFLKTTGLPYKRVADVNRIVDRLGEIPIYPVTVFGWDEQKLASQGYLIQWRNEVDKMLNTDSATMQKNYGYDYYQRYLAGLPGVNSDSAETIQRLASWFGVDLNATQIQQLDDYMNYNRTTNGCPSQCAGQPYRLERSAFDAHPDAKFDSKLRATLKLITTLPDYRLK